MSKRWKISLGVGAYGLALHVDAFPGEARVLFLAHNQVIGDVRGGAYAGGETILGHMRQSQRANLTGGFTAQGLAHDRYVPPRRGRMPVMASISSLCTVALNARNAQDLPRRTVRLTPAPRAVRGYPGLAGTDLHRRRCLPPGLALQRVQEHVLAHHHGRQDALVHVLGFRHAHQFALAHDAHAVGDGHDLVELVGDDDDGHLLFPHNAADDGKELVRLLGGQHGGGLVKDQHVGAAVQGFQNLHALLQDPR